MLDLIHDHYAAQEAGLWDIALMLCHHQLEIILVGLILLKVMWFHFASFFFRHTWPTFAGPIFPVTTTRHRAVPLPYALTPGLMLPLS